MLFCQLGHMRRSTLFVEYFLPCSFTNAEQVLIDVWVIQRSGDAIDVKTESPEQITADLKIAVVGSKKQHSLAALHHPLGSFDIFATTVFLPIVTLNQTRRKQHIDNKHDDLLKTSPPGFFDPCIVFFGKTGL